MKIGLQTWGTDGDFMPFLALAIGLKDAGHEVTLAYTSVDGNDYIDRDDIVGIELIKADGDLPVQRNFNPCSTGATPGSFQEYSILLNRFFEPYTEAMYKASVQLCKSCDLVVGHAVCHTLLTASERFHTPRISLILAPLVVRSRYVSPVGFDLGGVINSFLWNVGGFISTKQWFEQGKKLRKNESLPPVKSLQRELFTSNLLTIVAASEALCPRPKDWDTNIRMTGFLNPPDDCDSWQMPGDLKAFLKGGPSPIYMTLGGCMQFDVEASTQLLIEAARLSGKRAIIQSFWNRVAKPTDPNIYCIGRVPHSQVFPLCSQVVHHGSAGTTQAALSAGKPSVVIAHAFDQVYWAEHLYKTGVATKPILRTQATSKSIADSLKQLETSNHIRQKASDIGQQMRNEDGLRKAVSLIEKLA